MENALERLHAHDIDVVGVGFSSAERLDRLQLELGLSFPLHADLERRWYRALGVPRGSWPAVLAPRILRRYLRALARGERIPLPRDDLRQLGGDVLLCDAVIIATWVSGESERRPAIAEIVEAADAARQPD